MTHTVDVQGNHDSLHSCMLGILATDFCLLGPHRFRHRGGGRSRNDCQSEHTPQHEARQLTFLTETARNISPSDSNDSQTTSIIQCQPAVAAGALRRLVPAPLEPVNPCFNLKVASRTTHWGKVSVFDVICLHLQMIFNLFVDGQV